MTAILMPDARDQLRVQKALPGYMFALLFDSLRKEGYEVRMDLEELANKASAGALIGTISHHMVKLAKEIERVGHSALKNAGTDSVRMLVGALALAMVKLKDDGFDVDHDGVLVALGIAAEIDDGVTDWGRRNQLVPIMVRIANSLQRSGYFTDRTQRFVQLTSLDQ